MVRVANDAHHVAEHRQEHVVELPGDLSPHAQVLPVVGPEAAERKHVPETAAAEQHEQRRAERPARNRVAEKDEHAADEIELRAVAHGLDDAERHADQIAQEESGQAEEDRDGKPRLDHVPDRILVDVRRAEIEVHHVPEPAAA